MPRSGNGGNFPLQEISSKLSSDELVKRLKASQKFMSECDSVEGNLSASLTPIATSLIKPFVLHHKSRDVRLFAACCVAEVLRLFFPHPPYDEEQLKTAFSLCVAQLQGLDNPSSPAFKWSFQLLEGLASMKAFNLLLELDGHDILTELFKKIFAVVNDSQSTKVKMYMLDIMGALIQDGENLSQEVMDAFLINLTEPNKTDNQAAYALSVEFIKRSSQYLEPYIQLFFNNALVVGKSAESEVGDHLYELILELHGIDSSVLLSVMPQLEFKLKSSDTEERLEVTRLLARMFSPKDSRLAIENKPLWLCFVGRFNDVSPSVRVECVKFSKYFLAYHSNLVSDTAKMLHERFHDKEEKVRLEVVRAVCEAAAESIKIVPQMLLDDLQERMRDKVWSIRKEALTNVAKLYRQLMSSSFSSGVTPSRSDGNRVNWMANKILHSYYQTGSADRLCVERCFLSCIVPLTLPQEERMERLVHVYYSLDSYATKALNNVLMSRHQLRQFLLAMIRYHDDVKSEHAEQKRLILTQVIQLARALPDGVKAQAHLQELVTMLNDDKLRESLQQAIDVNRSCSEVVRAKSEVLSRIGSQHGVMETVHSLLDRCCPMLLDASCVVLLVERSCRELTEPSLSSEEEEREECERARKTLGLVKVLAEVTPSQFSSAKVFEELIGLLRHEDPDIASTTLQILTMTGNFIDQSMTGCLKPILIQLAQEGSSDLAKHTVKCISTVFKEPTPIIERLCSTLSSHLNYDHPHLPTSLCSLAQIAHLYPAVFKMKHKAIVSEFVVKKLLVQDRAKGEYIEGDEEWCENDAVSYETQVKVLGVKLLVSWLLGLRDGHTKASQPVLRLMATVLAHDGDLKGEDNISAPNRSRMRLAAAVGMLRLAQNSHYYDLTSAEQFHRLTLVMQDTCEEVRDQFAAKLNKGLRTLKLPLAFMGIFSLAGIEPRKEARAMFRQMIIANVDRRRKLLKQHSKAKENPQAILPEYALSHTIHLLSYHPDFSRTDPKALDNFKDCLWFFLEPVLHRSDNYGFLRKILETVKLMEDATELSSPETNKNLYAVCDLALGVLKKKVIHIKLGDYPDDVMLPSRLFVCRSEVAKSNDICYLPPTYDCTPTKRFKTEPLSVSMAADEDAETTPTKRGKGRPASDANTSKASSTPTATPAKQSRPKKTLSTPKKQSAKSQTPTKKRGTPKVKTTPRGKTVGKKRGDEETELKMEVVEGNGEVEVRAARGRGTDGGEEDHSSPARGKKQPKSPVKPTAKRNVRRKVFQSCDEEDKMEDSDEKQECTSEVRTAQPSSSTKRTRQKADPPRLRRTLRKTAQSSGDDEENQGVLNGTVDSESQSDTEATPSPKKMRVDAAAMQDDISPQKSSLTVKRKMRRRR